MPELNCDTPITYCQLRKEYLYNGKRPWREAGTREGDVIPCAIFGASAIRGRAIGFHCVLNNGVVVYRLPISAFVHLEPDSALVHDLPLDFLELWDCLSDHITCTEYKFLRGLRVDVFLKDRTWMGGSYLYTLDFHQSDLSDNPGEGGHKCAHIIELDNGQYAAQPNNRLRWFEPSFITEDFPQNPDYETQNRIFSVEAFSKWRTENSNKMFYDLKTDG